jgi:spore maturation protein CgeB
MRAMRHAHPLRRMLPQLDLVMTYGGGPPVIAAYEAFGARRCVPVYNALDPDEHHPVPPVKHFAADLGFLGNRLPDREARVEEFFLEPARLLPHLRFTLGGNGWEDKPMPPMCAASAMSIRGAQRLQRLPLAVLNVARDSMAEVGFSPATRVFEAAGAGACLITDAWEGIELFLKPGEEVLAARDGADVAEHLAALTPGEGARIGRAARRAHPDRAQLCPPGCAGRCAAARGLARGARSGSHEAGRRLGLSLSSSWGNGHATTWRALLAPSPRAATRCTFLERDVPGTRRTATCRSRNSAASRSIATSRARRLDEEIAAADAVIVGSYVPEGVAVGAWCSASRAA